MEGRSTTVDARVIGEEELVGSIGSHNHPIFEGFDRGDAHSVDDVKFTVEHQTGIEYVATGNKKFCFGYSGDLSADEIGKAYEDARLEIYQEAFENDGSVDFPQEAIMNCLAQKLEGFTFYEL